jgi:putative flippase GtrA
MLRGGLAGQPVRYLAAGVLSAALDVGLLVLLREVVGVPVPVATAVAFLTALVVNFTLNRRTFATGSQAARARHARRYLTAVAGNLLLTVAVVSAADAAGIPYVVAKLAVLGGGVVWNFFLYRHWVFR